MLADIADSQVAPREREESVTGDAAASAEPKSAEAIVPSISGGDVAIVPGADGDARTDAQRRWPLGEPAGARAAA